MIRDAKTQAGISLDQPLDGLVRVHLNITQIPFSCLRIGYLTKKSKSIQENTVCKLIRCLWYVLRTRKHAVYHPAAFVGSTR